MPYFFARNKIYLFLTFLFPCFLTFEVKANSDVTEKAEITKIITQYTWFLSTSPPYRKGSSGYSTGHIFTFNIKGKFVGYFRTDHETDEKPLIGTWKIVFSKLNKLEILIRNTDPKLKNVRVDPIVSKYSIKNTK